MEDRKKVYDQTAYMNLDDMCQMFELIDELRTRLMRQIPCANCLTCIQRGPYCGATIAYGNYWFKVQCPEMIAATGVDGDPEEPA